MKILYGVNNNKIDEIISSDKMGDFMGYLMLINSKQK